MVRRHPRRAPRPVLPLTATLLMTVCAAIASADDTPKEFKPRGTVANVKGQPIIGAEITLHRWDGVMSPALEKTATDNQGRFEFRSRREDAYYYVVIRQAPYTPVDQIVGSGPAQQ